MTLRDQALAALDEAEEARRLQLEADKARKRAEAAQRTRQFFANIGVSLADVEILEGGKFIIDGMPGTVHKHDGHGKFFWWCQPHEPGRGGTYNSAIFTDLPSLGRAIKTIDQAKAIGRYHP